MNLLLSEIISSNNLIRYKLYEILSELECEKSRLSGVFSNPGCFSKGFEINKHNVKNVKDPRYLPIRFFIKSLHRFYNYYPVWGEVISYIGSGVSTYSDSLGALCTIDSIEEQIYSFLLGLHPEIDLEFVLSISKDYLPEELLKRFQEAPKPKRLDFAVNFICKAGDVYEIRKLIRYILRQGYCFINVSSDILQEMFEVISLAIVEEKQIFNKDLLTVQMQPNLFSALTKYKNSLIFCNDTKKIFSITQ